MEQRDKVWRRLTIFCIVFLSFIGLVLSFWSVPVNAADQENCMLCHRYSGISAFTPETGTKKIFYVNELIFRNTVHGAVQCTHCHPDVKEVPHKPTKKVDCSLKCHVKEPSTEKDFSHKPIMDQLKASAHGQSKLFQDKEGQVKCKYCHQNPIYQPMSDILAAHEDAQEQTLTRCMGCHEKDEWTKRFLQHFVSRTKARWGNREIVDLCNNCHANEELMHKFWLDTTKNFKENFHYRNVKYNLKYSGQCLDCHAPSPLGYTPHKILGSSDPNSPTNIALRTKTCGQSGCHPAPTIPFVKGSLHGSGQKVQLLKTQLTQLEGELNEEETIELTERLSYEKTERLKNLIIWAIKLFYKIMILIVPGNMLLHQMLDLRITLKERKEGGH